MNVERLVKILIDRKYDRYLAIDGILSLEKIIKSQDTEPISVVFKVDANMMLATLEIIDCTISIEYDADNRFYHKIESNGRVLEQLIELYSVYSYESNGLNRNTAVPVAGELMGIISDVIRSYEEMCM